MFKKKKNSYYEGLGLRKTLKLNPISMSKEKQKQKQEYMHRTTEEDISAGAA
jgi:hypothetical protein